MKKITLILLSVLMITSVFVGVSIAASAANSQSQELIPVPDIPAINRPYKTIEELGIDFEKVEAYFPQEIEIRCEDGKVYVEDIGAGSARCSASQTKDLELVDGYWTGDYDGEIRHIYFYSYENYGDSKYWYVTYYADGTRDPYIILEDDTKDVYVSFSYEDGYASVLYTSGDYFYEDAYRNGVLKTHGVGNHNDTEAINKVYYDVNGEISYCALYTNTHSYYYPNQGWSSSWDSFIERDAPAGYEDIDETYFTANKPSLICNRAEGDDIVHDMEKASCSTLATCKNGCGYTEGYTLPHSWVDSEIQGKKVCTVCDALLLPDFEFVTRTYQTLAETGFDAKKILDLFPSEVETKYENGKYMIKDVGAFSAEYLSTVDYVIVPMTFEDGYWTVEISEEAYNAVIDADEDFYVGFYGEYSFWKIGYYNGRIADDVQISSRGNVNAVLMKTNDDFVEFLYPLYDKDYRDTYSKGSLIEQEVTAYFDGNNLSAHYFADGTIDYVALYVFPEGWFYYVPGFGWATLPDADPEYACNAPQGFEDADAEFFAALAPTTINCTHEEYVAADCQNPERCSLCGIAKEGSEKLDHDMSDATCTEPATCKNGCGHTEGEALGHDWTALDIDLCEYEWTCERCGETAGVNVEHDWTIFDIDLCEYQQTCRICGETIGENVEHDWIDATCTEPATCAGCGHTKGDVLGHVWIAPGIDLCEYEWTCMECGETKGKNVEHDWIGATCTEPATCKVCGETEGETLGHDWADATYNTPKTCTVCGETEGEPLPKPEEPTESDTTSGSETESDTGTEEPTESETESDSDNSADEPTEVLTQVPTEVPTELESDVADTKAPTDAPVEQNTESTDEGNNSGNANGEKGCGSSVAGGATVISVVFVAAYAFIRKKKED